MTGVSYRDLLSGDAPVKSLVKGYKLQSGRNAFGRLTTRHRGGGHKRRFRAVDFKYDKLDIPFTVRSVEYDPNRSGFIGAVSFRDGERRYVLLPQSVTPGDELLVSREAPIKPGNRLPLSNIPVGTYIYNLELKPGEGARVVRSAGSYAEVIGKDAGYVDIKLPSSEVRRIVGTAWASVGEVSNQEYKLINYGKAGRRRWLGRRPKVRGSAMNPVDHPRGGGEGRSPRGLRREKTWTGRIADKGQKTRKSKKYSNRLIIQRRRKRK